MGGADPVSRDKFEANPVSRRIFFANPVSRRIFLANTVSRSVGVNTLSFCLPMIYDLILNSSKLSDSMISRHDKVIFSDKSLSSADISHFN